MLASAHDVTLDDNALRSIAIRALQDPGPGPIWRTAPHWWDESDPERTARYVLLLDALNFSFWGEPRWRVTLDGMTHDGYWALAAALRRALDAGLPLLNSDYLMNEARAETVLASDDGTVIPLLAERQAALREVGAGLKNLGGFLPLVQQAAGSAPALVTLVAEHFPSFRDVALYAGRLIPFYKRAQILVSDLWGACEGSPPGAFHDLHLLTMFADYKVPQALHALGALHYSSALTAALRDRTELPANDPREVEIRAASVQAVERIAAFTSELGHPIPPFQLDWHLWSYGQRTDLPLPYHRTRTVAY